MIKKAIPQLGPCVNQIFTGEKFSESKDKLAAHQTKLLEEFAHNRGITAYSVAKKAKENLLDPVQNEFKKYSVAQVINRTMSDKELLARQSAMLQEIVRQREQKRAAFEGHPLKKTKSPGDPWCKETAHDVYAGDIMNEGKRKSSSHSDISLSKRQDERIPSIIKIPPSIEALQSPAKQSLKKGLFKINSGQYLRIHSRRRARDAIANNRAIHVRCSVCEKSFLIEESTRLLFCTNCTSLSTLF